MSKKGTKIPDSDQTARTEYESTKDDASESAGDLAGRQTSNKMGKHSAVLKKAASRPEFGGSPVADHTPGAHGNAASKRRKPAVSVEADGGGDKARRKRSS